MAKTLPARMLHRLLAATAVAVPAAAHSQEATIAPASFGFGANAKTEAILGAPSKLAALLAQQNGAPAPIFSPAALQPASRSLPAATPAVIRTQRLISPAVASGKPDLFGSVALSVPHTRLDARWRRVERARVDGAAAGYAASLRDRSELGRIEAINWYVNKRVRFVDDSRQYGRPDLWSAANDTLSRGRGDCEDYAIAKLQMLRAAGIADRNLYLVIVKDLVRRSDHAVLVVRAAGRMLVLDNGTDELLDTEAVRDYRPVLTFAARGAWTHGYRRSLPTMTIASAEIRPLAPGAER